MAPLTYDPGADNLSTANIQNDEDYQSIFKPKHSLGELEIKYWIEIHFNYNRKNLKELFI